MMRPGNERLTDRHRAAARWLPTTDLEGWCIFLSSYGLERMRWRKIISENDGWDT